VWRKVAGLLLLLVLNLLLFLFLLLVVSGLARVGGRASGATSGRR
jgi:hypothetical protein